MATQAWLESSLRRSASLGQEVLERASRRSVDWTTAGASQTTMTPDEDPYTPHMKKTRTELDDAFDTIAEFMTQTTYQCKRFYESGCCPELSDTERNHVFRFHRRQAAGKMRSTGPPKKHVRKSAGGEEFQFEVSPGTYAVTASLPESQQQTRLVNVSAGESINLTFNL